MVTNPVSTLRSIFEKLVFVLPMFRKCNVMPTKKNKKLKKIKKNNKKNVMPTKMLTKI
jgi:hypothetical protein